MVHSSIACDRDHAISPGPASVNPWSSACYPCLCIILASGVARRAVVKYQQLTIYSLYQRDASTSTIATATTSPVLPTYLDHSRRSRVSAASVSSSVAAVDCASCGRPGPGPLAARPRHVFADVLGRPENHLLVVGRKKKMAGQLSFSFPQFASLFNDNNSYSSTTTVLIVQ